MQFVALHHLPSCNEAALPALEQGFDGVLAEEELHAFLVYDVFLVAEGLVVLNCCLARERRTA
jgi:hypothetical protein